MKSAFIALIFALTCGIAFGSDDYTEYKNILETTLKLREEILLRHKEVELILSKEHILAGAELETINKMALERFNLGEKALQFLEHHSDLVKTKIPKDFTPSSQDLKSVMMSLALGVTMADNHLMVYKVFHTNNKVRRLLNEYDQAYDKKLNMLRDSIHEFYSLRNRKKFKRAIYLYEKHFTALNEDSENEEFIHLAATINSSLFYQKFKQRNFWSPVSDLLSFLGTKLFHFKLYASDIGAKIIEDIIFDGSEIFGNTLGTIQFRAGKLKTDENFLPSVKSQLKVLDVLMERTPARATSNFIPGFWTHAAIYVGTEEDLRYYGIWDHPLVRNHQERIKNGASAIEALRTGVEINSLESFRDADTFSTIRLKVPLNHEQTRAHLLTAFAQLGKIYDFSFDIQSGKKIVCSELHYITFTEVPFNTSQILKRQTISIDQVAEQALTNRFFDVVNFWVDGKEMKEDLAVRYDITLLTQGRTILTEEERAIFSEIYDLETGQIRERKRANPISKSIKKINISDYQ